MSANAQELSQDSASENAQFFGEFLRVSDLALGLISGGLQPALSLVRRIGESTLGLCFARRLQFVDGGDDLGAALRHRDVEVFADLSALGLGLGSQSIPLGLRGFDDPGGFGTGLRHGLLVHGFHRVATVLEFGDQRLVVTTKAGAVLFGDGGHLGCVGLGLRAHLRGLVGGKAQHAADAIAHALRGGGRYREAVDVLAEVVDVVACIVELLGKVAGLRSGSITIGRGNSQLRVESLEVVTYLVAVVSLPCDLERKLDRTAVLLVCHGDNLPGIRAGVGSASGSRRVRPVPPGRRRRPSGE